MILSGPTIIYNEGLFSELFKIAFTIKNSDNQILPTILSDIECDLVLFELSTGSANEFELIKKIKTRFPDIDIVLLDEIDDCECVAQAFAYDIKDAFRKPYKIDLIIERIRALLQRHGAQ